MNTASAVNATPPEVIEQVRKLAGEGKKIREIAERTNLSNATVYKYIPRKKPVTSRRPITAAEVAEMKRLHAGGMIVAEIARTIKRPPTVVGRYLSRQTGSRAQKTIRAASKVKPPKVVPHGRLSDEETQTIFGLLNQGKSITEIAAQTGRGRLAIYRQRKLWKQTQIPAKETMNGNQSAASDIDHELESNFSYLFGRLEREAEIFSQSVGIPKSHVAARMAALFSIQGGGQRLRNSHRLSGMRDKTT